MSDSIADVSGKSYPPFPRAAVGVFVKRPEDGAVLLVLRDRPPSAGEWALPGGGVELGEGLLAAAERECFEECGLRVRALRPVYAFDSIHRDAGGRVQYHYVVTDVEAEYLEGEPRAADDAREARWIAPDKLNTIQLNKMTRSFLRVMGLPT